MVWSAAAMAKRPAAQNAHDALEADQDAIRLILSDDHQAPALAYQRMRVNRAHNALFNLAESGNAGNPVLTSHYLKIRLWVTHSQFIVEHITPTTGAQHNMLTPDLAQRYLESCEILRSSAASGWIPMGRGSAGM